MRRHRGGRAGRDGREKNEKSLRKEYSGHLTCPEPQTPNPNPIPNPNQGGGSGILVFLVSPPPGVPSRFRFPLGFPSQLKQRLQGKDVSAHVVVQQ